MTATAHHLCPLCECLVETYAPGVSYTTYQGLNYHPACLAAEGLDAYENSIVPLEEDPLPEKCKLCEKTIWPDDPTSMVNGDECHRLCGLDYRVSEQAEEIKELRRKISELSYRVPV